MEDASPTLLSRAKEALGLAGPLREVVAFEHQVTGVAIAEDGRRFFDFPRWTDDAPISVAEVQDTQWFTPGAPPSIKTQLFSFPPVQ